MIESINIVAFDVPFPANYGGVIDVFYKLKTFHKNGVKVHLHCFDYGRGKQEELEKYCEKVYYYKRKSGWWHNLSSTPYIVKTRSSKKLKRKLLSNDFPILFEGLHTCKLLSDEKLKNRVKIYRESNIEHRYYKHLASSEVNWFKKIYLRIEANKLKRFEPIVKHATHNFIVSQTDFHYFEMKYPNCDNHFIPSFHAGEKVRIQKGKGKFVLYHGNLSVSENYKAASYLLRKIFSVIDVPLIIAGLNPPEYLELEIKSHPHVTLIANPDEEKMNELIENAQVHFLFTHQATGLKLKLLNVLYKGRHCLVNSKMVEGTTLTECCHVEDDKDKQILLIKELISKEFEAEEVTHRTNILKENYSNEVNFNRIMEVLKLNKN
ncbi:MAG: hypothetical protein ACPGVD_03615 [Flavobacteriales bacterium]